MRVLSLCRCDAAGIVLRLIGPGNDFGSLYAHIIAMLALTLSVHLYLVPGFLVTTSSRSLNRTIGACMARQLGSCATR